MPRSSLAAVLALAMSACQPDLPHTDPTTVNQAVFDPTTSQIPLPNDLAFPPFNPDTNSVCPEGSTAPAGTAAACAQAELLMSFGGKFPSDQAVAVTIDFQATTGSKKEPVDFDFATFTSDTLVVMRRAPDNSVSQVEIEPVTAKDYANRGDHGTLSIHNKGNEPWPEGAYGVFVRGGDEGVKTASGAAIGPSQVFAIIAQGKDMTDPKNIGLLKAQTGSTEKALEQGAQLNALIAYYKTVAYPLIEPKFPAQELAVLTTFSVGAAYTNVTIDSARSKVPLPIDLLRDATKGTLTQTAACAFAQDELAEDGTCKAAAAAGFLALDGFSTTGAILAPTSDLVQASTVNSTTVKLYDLTNPQQPVLVDPTGLIFEPCEFTSACAAGALSPVIALQPAGATSGDPTSIFRSRPLKDSTDYAVVITTDVKDKANKAIAPGTVAKILRFKNPINVGGKSMLSGISDETTAQLEKMRLQLQPVFATLAGINIPEDKVAMAYTFRTQSILTTGVQLAALPYIKGAATGLPGDVTAYATVDAAYTAYGAPAGMPRSNIGEVIETSIKTFNLLDPATGAFHPNPDDAVEETIRVLVITPKTAAVTTACPGALSALKCSPLMVFRHGLSRGRADALAIADTLAAEGITTVAIDAAKHGDRSFCTSGGSGTAAGCNAGATCDTALPAGAQGDEHPPGQCSDGKLLHKGLNGQPAAEGVAYVSGNYLVTANFFRTRDTLRQDFIDESQLVRAMAYAPAGAPPTGHKLFDHMLANLGFVIDPTKIYYTGQSMGAIQGTANVAINPRITKAALNVGGGTLVDVFTNSPAFAPTVNALLASLGIDKVNNPSGYLQFLVVAKTVLDPADAINFAGHLTHNTLPNLLADQTGKTAQSPKKILTQIANCDTTVPNPFNLIHSSNIGVGPTPAAGASFFAPGAKGTFQLFVGNGFNPAGFGNCAVSGGAVPHSFLLDFATPTQTLAAQQSIADFVTNDTTQLSVEAP